MAYYPSPTENDTLGFYEFFKYINGVSDGAFFPLMLLVVWVIVFVATKQYSNSRAWTSASFICMVMGFGFAVLDLVSPRWAYLMILFIGIGALWMKLEDSN
jgi:hypothetical protein